MTKTLRIAIVSDLHCQGFEEKKKRRESFLAVADARVPEGRHPVQSLIKLIEDSMGAISADVTICVGDMTHKIAEDGFSTAWGLLGELKSKFNSTYCFSTLGNHDINSRSSSGDPFCIAKTIHPEFPFSIQEDSNCYWTNGYCLQSVTDYADFLMINTSYDHYSEEQAKRGSFDIAQISSLDKYLKKHCKNKLRIAVMHHNPILHSFHDFTSTDVLATGDQLISVLSQHGFRLIIHGHKHEPRVTRCNSRGNQLHIFSAGSFAVYLNELGSITRNLFHLIELNCEAKGADYVIGTIKSWEFNYGSGWNPSSLRSAYFPHIVNIGPTPPVSLVDDICAYFSRRGDGYIGKDEFIKEFEAISHMLPDEIAKLCDNLKSTAHLKVEIDELGIVMGAGKLYQPKSEEGAHDGELE